MIAIRPIVALTPPFSRAAPPAPGTAPARGPDPSHATARRRGPDPTKATARRH